MRLSYVHLLNPRQSIFVLKRHVLLDRQSGPHTLTLSELKYKYTMALGMMVYGIVEDKGYLTSSPSSDTVKVDSRKANSYKHNDDNKWKEAY